MTDVIETTQTETIVIVEESAPDIIQVVSVGPQGPGDKVLLLRVADGPIGGQRMVIGNADGTCSYADTTTVAHVGKVLGMSMSAVLDGETVKILREGMMEFVGWSFDTSLPVYLGVNGVLTQSASATGFSQIVGFAEAPTKLFVSLREPIIL